MLDGMRSVSADGMRLRTPVGAKLAGRCGRSGDGEDVSRLSLDDVWRRVMEART
jgi:hypothetical protein